MLRVLFASTAIVGLVSTGVLAQTTTSKPMVQNETTSATGEMGAVGKTFASMQAFMGSDLIGETVRGARGKDDAAAQNSPAMSTPETVPGVPAPKESVVMGDERPAYGEAIGEIDDIVVTANGELGAVVVSVGGFLGIGEKQVEIEWKTVQVLAGEGERVLYVPMTREQLEAAPVFDREAALQSWSERRLSDAKMGGQGRKAMSGSASSLSESAALTSLPEGLTPMKASEARAENLIGGAVYGPGEERLGEVGDLIIEDGGAIQAMIVDFGGFLGVGEKMVAVDYEDITLMKDDEGEPYLVTSLSESELQAAPEYREIN